MSMLGGQTEVKVEPTKSPTAAGGVKWLVRVDGVPGRNFNFKDDAVDHAKTKARGANGTLTVLTKDMTVSESRDYS